MEKPVFALFLYLKKNGNDSALKSISRLKAFEAKVFLNKKTLASKSRLKPTKFSN